MLGWLYNQFACFVNDCHTLFLRFWATKLNKKILLVFQLTKFLIRSSSILKKNIPYTYITQKYLKSSYAGTCLLVAFLHGNFSHSAEFC